MQEGTTRGEHRINHEDTPTAEILRQGFQVRHRLVGFFIARHANEAHLGIRDHGQCRINHAQASANNGHDDRRILQAGTVGRGDGSDTLKVLNGQVARRLINEHGAQISQGSAEGSVVAAGIAHEGQPGCGEGVVYYVDIHVLHCIRIGREPISGR